MVEHSLFRFRIASNKVLYMHFGLYLGAASELIDGALSNAFVRNRKHMGQHASLAGAGRALRVKAWAN